MFFSHGNLNIISHSVYHLCFSGIFSCVSLLCDELGEEKENAALKQPCQRKKHQKPQALMQSEYSGSNTNAPLTAAPTSKGRKRKSSDENGDKQLTAANSTWSPTKPSSGNKSSHKSADVEAARLRAKTFFDSVTVDLSSGTDEPPVSANTMSDPEGNRDEPIESQWY